MDFVANAEVLSYNHKCHEIERRDFMLISRQENEALYYMIFTDERPEEKTDSDKKLQADVNKQ